MVPATEWYKCDLQVATPGWKFGDGPESESAADRAAFCDEYMSRLSRRGIQVIALADHHGATWLEDMRAAGRRAGITVFPGVEVTTGSGKDGIHLVFIGDLSKTDLDIDRLLHGVCGFDDRDNPRFDPGTGDPAPAPRSISDILDQVDEDWFVIAAHVLTDNGLVSTTSGVIRWKALHHRRISALDPGGRGKEHGKDSFNAKVRTREVDYFPGLKKIAFISTSDAYDLDSLGSRFTWIRMAEPSLEGLRQAALDHEARIIRDIDPRLHAIKDGDPNNVEHAWIESVRIEGTIGNSEKPIDVPFHAGLNVIVGGRGSGKSTVVAGLLHLYSDFEATPSGILSEAKRFSEQVFSAAEIKGVHHLAHSGERQEATWTAKSGPTTIRGGMPVRTGFSARVFSQKELFELTSTREDQHAASLYLLRLVDAELGLEESSTRFPAGYSATLQSAVDACVAAVAARQAAERAERRLPEVIAHHSEVRRQVEAFGDPSSQAERREKEQALHTQGELAEIMRGLEDALRKAPREATTSIRSVPIRDLADRPLPAQLLFHEMNAFRDRAVRRVEAAIELSLAELRQALEVQKNGEWARQVAEAEAAILAFQGSLSELGVNPSQYLELREEMSSSESAISNLTSQAEGIDALRDVERVAWSKLDLLDAEIGSLRDVFLDRISSSSGTLRFVTRSRSNAAAWAKDIRRLLSLREGSFIEDVQAVADWLWDGEASLEERIRRLTLWRRTLSDNEFEPLRDESVCRPEWWARLSKADQVVRVRAATLVAEDTVEMYFLRDGGKAANDTDWQLVSTGSPGQRTAAMLGFVLNHGTEPLILDQPEDDLDASLITSLIVSELRRIRWTRQVIVVTHNANIPVIGDAERIIVMNNDGRSISPKTSTTLDGHAVVHIGPIEVGHVREDIQEILEGGRAAFIARERRYQNDLDTYHEAQLSMRAKAGATKAQS